MRAGHAGRPGMIVDSRQGAPDPNKTYDICIIGAGAAGITLALELAASNLTVCVLESGGFEFDEDVHDLAIGENVGRDYDGLDAGRLRYLGGTTNHWGGWCRPFSAFEMEKRSWVPESGWPISLSDLEPYYRAANTYCQIEGDGYDVSQTVAAAKNPRLSELSLQGTGFYSSLYRFSPPTRFGEAYRERLKQAKTIEVFLFANVLELTLSHDANSIVGVKAGTLSGARFNVTARRYVLATGGLENARLLLLSRNVAANGIGNQHDLVGRFFMEHPTLVGMVAPTGKQSMDLYDIRIAYNELGFVASLEVEPEMQRERQLLAARAEFSGFFDGEDAEGTKSFKALTSQIRNGQWPDNLGKHLGNIVTDIDDVAKAIYGYLTGDAENPNFYSVGVGIEQRPNPDSRVMLSESKDAFGLNRIKLDWRLTAEDYRTAEETSQLIAKTFGAKNIGRVRMDLDNKGADGWPEEIQWGSHHMGTTRMSDSPKSGVVDRDCRVHGIANLYVAGSSVFPTSGAGVPTLTIVALAVRLAKHLRQQLG